MKVIFKTNIDAYQSNCFPTNFTKVPRIGDSVMVLEVFESYFANERFPVMLKVVDVIWAETSSNEMVAICELHYSINNFEIASLNNVKLFG